MMSVAPPAGNGTTIRTGFVGYAGACATAAPVQTSMATQAMAIATRAIALDAWTFISFLSIDLCARCLDDASVLGNLFADEGRELVRSRRRRLGALRDKALAHVGRIQDS